MLKSIVQSDEELIKSAQMGRQDAFIEIYERYFPIVHRRVCYKIPADDVEDVTQEIFLSVMKSLNSFKGEAKFSTWIWTLTSRKIADYYRSRKPAAIKADDIEMLDGMMNNQSRSQHQKQDEKMLVDAALRKLPGNYQEILEMRFVDGLPFMDIAKMKNQSLEATKSLFRRAMISLRKTLGVGDV